MASRLLLPASPTGGHRLPKFFSDIEVRDLALACHRQMTLDEALSCITEKVGPRRTPSRSSLHRFWQRLDGLNEGHVQ